jgi:hypothetical protein
VGNLPRDSRHNLRRAAAALAGPFNLEVVRTFIEMANMKCTWAPNG